MVPKIIIGFVVQLILAFGHALVILNLTEDKTYVLHSSREVVNWALFGIFFFMQVTQARRFSSDYMKLMNQQKVDDEAALRFHEKRVKVTGAICLAVGVAVFGSHC